MRFLKSLVTHLIIAGFIIPSAFSAPSLKDAVTAAKKAQEQQASAIHAVVEQHLAKSKITTIDDFKKVETEIVSALQKELKDTGMTEQELRNLVAPELDNKRNQLIVDFAAALGKTITATNVQSTLSSGDSPKAGGKAAGNSKGVGATNQPSSSTDPAVQKLEAQVANLNALAEKDTLKGFNFGVGLSLTVDVGTHNRIKSAELDGANRIRVKEEKNDIPRFVLESHYFFTPHWLNENAEEDKQSWGHGPFVCVQPGENIVDAVGAGWMIGFKRHKLSTLAAEPGSFNIGVGVMVDPTVQVLGDGQREGEVLPNGETSIRYKTTSQTGIIGVFSVVF